MKTHRGWHSFHLCYYISLLSFFHALSALALVPVSAYIFSIPMMVSITTEISYSLLQNMFISGLHFASTLYSILLMIKFSSMDTQAEHVSRGNTYAIKTNHSPLNIRVQLLLAVRVPDNSRPTARPISAPT